MGEVGSGVARQLLNWIADPGPRSGQHAQHLIA
jgi:hypothetical protein